MRVIALHAGQLNLTECPVPQITEEEVLIKVAYAGINRADLFQKQGRYPLPEGSPAVPGMEVSGVVSECGKKVSAIKVSEKVCALLTQGGYGEYVAVPASLVLPLSANTSLEDAACLPEACFTGWISLIWQAGLKPGEIVLIHGGAGGIGSVIIQMARLLGARVFATAGSDEKCASCVRLGAEKAINYRTHDFVVEVKKATGGRGVDIILDAVGGDYFERNLDCLAQGGRLCIIAFLKGANVTASLSPILLKRLSVMGSTLRARPLSEKARIAMELKERVWPAVAKGLVKPVIDQIFPLHEAEKALKRVDQGLNVGKILLKL